MQKYVNGELVDLTPEEAAEHEAEQAAAIEASRAQLVVRIKAEAGRRIVAIMPEHKQRNHVALSVEMITAHGHDTANWPQAARDLYDAVMPQWAMIKQIRVASNIMEQDIPGMTPEEIQTYDPAKDPRWP